MDFTKEQFEGGEILIRENKFYIFPFSAIEAFRLQAVLMQKFGPALGELLGVIDISNLKDINIADTEINMSRVSGALQTLFSGLGEDDYLKLIMRLIKNTECIFSVGDKKQKIKLDNETAINTVFQKHTFDIFQLIIAILKVNYADFFVLLEGIGDRIKTVISESMNINTEKSLIQSEK